MTLKSLLLANTLENFIFDLTFFGCNLFCFCDKAVEQLLDFRVAFSVHETWGTRLKSKWRSKDSPNPTNHNSRLKFGMGSLEPINCVA
jgi:hypothetical protein